MSYIKMDQDAKRQEFADKMSAFNTMWWVQKDREAMDAWKYSAISDWFGWITLYNTKTGEIKNTWNPSPMTASQQKNYTSAGWNLINNLERTWNNVGADTNNFGNITSATPWSIGMYRSPKWITYAVYATAQDWYNALLDDIKAKQSGQTNTWLTPNSTAADLFRTWVGKWVKQSYLNMAANAAWVSLSDKIWNIDANKLATGIMAAEWTLKAYKSWGKDLSQYRQVGSQISNNWNYSIAAQRFMDTYDPTNKEQTVMLNKVYWLTPDDVARYKASRLLNNTDYSTVLQSLSPAAQDVVKWNRSLSDMWMKARKQIQDELSNSWIDDFWLGNQDYWMLKNSDKIWLRQYLQIQDRLNIIDNALKNWTQTWWLKELWEWGRNILWVWVDADFNDIKTNAGKNLVEYIKNISGTAVSDQERKSLMELLPNPNMSTDKFKDSLASFKREYKNMLNWYVSDYWFDSIEALNSAMGMSSLNVNNNTNHWNSYLDTYNKIQNNTIPNDTLSRLLWK
jgi:hypothetical protein